MFEINHRIIPTGDRVITWSWLFAIELCHARSRIGDIWLGRVNHVKCRDDRVERKPWTAIVLI